MKPYRSSLFVPGHRADWIEKAAGYGADCLILDLEDSVPASEKIAARAVTRAGVRSLHAKGQAVQVRVNGFATGLTLDDIEAVLCVELHGIALPKVETIEDMRQLDALITQAEARLGIPSGKIDTPLVLETARAMRNVFDIASACPRVRHVNLAAGPGGDAARSVGFAWSKEGTETLYLRSKTVLDCRAAGVLYPMVSSWWNIKDLEGLEQDARRNRQLGFRGQIVMHPTHVPIVNGVFTPSADELAFCRGLITAMDEAEKRGIASVTYMGDMVDHAMAQTAREMLAFARSIGADR